MKRLFCFFGLHLHLNYHIKWVDHPEGMLGYWYCPTCLTTFNGYIHERNKDGGASGWRIREASKTEVKNFLRRQNDTIQPS
jgi:hypothetical protein